MVKRTMRLAVSKFFIIVLFRFYIFVFLHVEVSNYLIENTRLAANVGACAVAGIGGLGNGAERNAKTDQLRPVPRDKCKMKLKGYWHSEPQAGINSHCFVSCRTNDREKGIALAHLSSI